MFHLEVSAVLESICTPIEDATAAPRLAIVAAHPDDEVIGAGGRLQRLSRAMFVHVTDGAPRDGRDATAHGFSNTRAYADQRRIELEAALALAGIAPWQTRQLRWADQEASHHLVELSHQIAAILMELDPAAVLTHPYEGGHPDHDATAFAVHAARWLLRNSGKDFPAIVEMTSYHNGPEGLVSGEFLPANSGEPSGQTITLMLSDTGQQFKRRLLECFASQRMTLQYFPVGIERFRLAPAYDFVRPPHEGVLFYEQFPWGMTGGRFCELAKQAQQELGITGTL